MAGLPSASDRRGVLAGIGAGLAGLALAGCRRGSGGGTELILGDQVHLSQAKLEAAHALDGVPYRIKWASFAGAAPLLEALNAEAVDTAPAGDLPIVRAASAGCRLKVIAISRSKPAAMGIIVPARSPVRSVADLAGQTVVVSSARGSIAHYLLLEALREADVPQSAVKIAFMLPTDAAAAFATGQIAAWATFGIYQARAEQGGARVIRDGSGIGPGYSAITASEAALADPAKRVALQDFLKRAQRASHWCAEHPDAYASLFARQTGSDPVLARIVVSRELPILSAPDDGFASAVQRAADRFLEYGVLPRRVDVVSLLNSSLLGA